MSISVKELYEQAYLLHDKTMAVLQEELNNAPVDLLNKRPAPKQWTALEAIEHLVLFNKHYYPQINSRLDNAEKLKTVQEVYRPGKLGKWMYNLVRTDEDGMPVKTSKKTVKGMNPAKGIESTNTGNLNKEVLHNCIRQQEIFRMILNKSQQYDLEKIKLVSAAGFIIKFNLGDIIRILAAHNYRHVMQAKRALAQAKQ